MPEGKFSLTEAGCLPVFDPVGLAGWRHRRRGAFRIIKRKCESAAAHTRRQSAEECPAVFELIDALISWSFILLYLTLRDTLAALFRLTQPFVPLPLPLSLLGGIFSLPAESRRTAAGYIGRILRLRVLLSPIASPCNAIPVIVASRRSVFGRLAIGKFASSEQRHLFKEKFVQEIGNFFWKAAECHIYMRKVSQVKIFHWTNSIQDYRFHRSCISYIANLQTILRLSYVRSRLFFNFVIFLFDQFCYMAHLLQQCQCFKFVVLNGVPFRINKNPKHWMMVL